MSEQRRFERIPVELAGEMLVKGEHVHVATDNLSEGGVGLLLEHTVPDGTKIDLTLFLTQDGIEDPDEEPFEAKCVVRWTGERDDGMFLVGVQFESLDTERRAQLHRFLEALAAC